MQCNKFYLYLFSVFIVFGSSWLNIIEILDSLNTSLLPYSNTTDESSTTEIRAQLSEFIQWFSPLLVTLSLSTALVCPFLCWILQERCLSSKMNDRSSTLLTMPQLLVVGSETQKQEINKIPTGLRTSCAPSEQNLWYSATEIASSFV
ncbi:unnamed protein product [Adineta ricciae]|uniref:Uncharacterized protein n=1 Tax=Adineta ricciae TaxID=249248 RepID=A0A814FFS3_ADIRI|nr:unnamed protein product [Adineta ricciae]CAF0982735.1 unnamed protein product [Adineta ricciae]